MKLVRTSALNGILAAAPHKNADGSKIGDTWIEYETAIELGRLHDMPLAVLLRGTAVYQDPAPERPAKSAEYLRLMERLRREQAEKEYQALVNAKESESVSIARINKEVNSQLTTILNVLISILAIAWAFWYWCSSWPLPARTLMSLFAGLFVGVAEVVVFAGYQRRAAQPRPQPSDTPKVLKTIVFDHGEAREENLDAEETLDEVKSSRDAKKSTVRRR